jgi:hypothetical protein
MPQPSLRHCTPPQPADRYRRRAPLLTETFREQILTVSTDSRSIAVSDIEPHWRPRPPSRRSNVAPQLLQRLRHPGVGISWTSRANSSLSTDMWPVYVATVERPRTRRLGSAPSVPAIATDHNKWQAALPPSRHKRPYACAPATPNQRKIGCPRSPCEVDSRELPNYALL